MLGLGLLICSMRVGVEVHYCYHSSVLLCLCSQSLIFPFGFLGTGCWCSFCPKTFVSWQVRAGGFYPILGPSASLHHCVPSSWHEAREGGGTLWGLAKRQGSCLSNRGRGRSISGRWQAGLPCAQAQGSWHLLLSLRLWSSLAGDTPPAAQAVSQTPWRDKEHQG